MADRIPTLRRKSNGCYFVRWGGKDWGMGSDARAAREAWLSPKSTHPGRLSAWQTWREAGGGPLNAPARTSRRGTGGARGERASSPLAVDAAADMIESYLRQGHEQSARNLRTSLKRFLSAHGAATVVDLATPRPERGIFLAPVIPLLEALRDDMLTPDDRGLTYAAHTINHDLGAVCLLMQHAARRGWCPPVAFGTLQRQTPPAASPEDLSPEGIRWLLRIAQHRRPELVPLLEAQYYTLCRTSELLTLVAAWAGDASAGSVRARTEWGHEVGDRGFVELLKHKNSHRGPTYRRFILITPPAAAALDRTLATMRPPKSPAPSGPGSLPWGRVDGYQHAVLHAVALGPRVLRDSAASNLRLQGVDLADVDLLLGHTPGGAIGSYARAPWPALRAKAAQLALRPGP
jgi:hypothetical protein